SEFKFACPTCQQHISADQSYAGMQINCPACNSPMIVPGAAAPAPVPAPVPFTAPPPAPAPPPPLPPPPAPIGAPAPAAAGAKGGCPSCGKPLPRGAVICTQCGYNLATKKRTVAGRQVGLGS